MERMRTYSITLAAVAGFYALIGLALHWNAPVRQRAAFALGLSSDEELARQGYERLLAGVPAPESVEPFRTLVLRNPASPYTWATLAEALAQTGDPSGANQAMRIALERGPSIPQVRIRAANLFADLGDQPAAAQSFARVLALTPAFDQVVFDAFRRIGLTPRQVLTILPEDPRVARVWFYDLCRRGTPQDLAIAWAWLLQRGYVDKEMGDAYLHTRFSNPSAPRQRLSLLQSSSATHPPSP